MLYDTRYPREISLGLDGVNYHFSAKLPGNINYAGKVWSPKESSKTGNIVKIADHMLSYCLEGRTDIKKQLEKKVDELKKQLEYQQEEK